MYSALDFYEFYGDDIFSQRPEQFGCWQSVNAKASRHVQQSQYTELYEVARPHEEEVYRNWRENNKRHVTSAPLGRFISMMNRVVSYSSHPLDSFKDVPEKFSKVVNSLPFEDNDSSYSFDEFRHKVLIPLAMEDPNSIIVEMPFNKGDRLNPITSVSKSTSIEYISKIIPYYEIIKMPSNEEPVLCWLGGYVEIGTEEDPNHQPYYFMCDKEAYYAFFPRENASKEIVWDWELWYTHKSGRILYTKLIGRTERVNTYSATKTKTVSLTHPDKKEDRRNITGSIKFRNTFIAGALPYFDEAVVRLGQDQVNMARHLDPIRWVNGDLECPTCGGARKVKKRIAGYGSREMDVDCPSCQGQGGLTNIGSFSTIKVRGGHHSSDKTPSVPVGYASPPTANLEISNRSWQEWIKLGINEICIDPLDGRGEGESGVKAKLRMVPKDDLMKEFGDEFMRMSEDILNNKHSLIFSTEDRIFNFPRSLMYSVLTGDQLFEEYKNKPLGLKHDSYMKWINSEYRGNDEKVKIMELASCYAPLMHYSESELDTAIGTQTYAQIDIIRRDFAQKIFTELIEENPDAERTHGEWAVLADQWLIDNNKIEVGVDEPELGGGEIIEGDTPNGTDGGIDDLDDPDSLDNLDAGDVLGDDAETNSSNSKEAQLEVIFNALTQGKMSREVAITKMAELTGETEEVIDGYLKEIGL